MSCLPGASGGRGLIYCLWTVCSDLSRGEPAPRVQGSRKKGSSFFAGLEETLRWFVLVSGGALLFLRKGCVAACRLPQARVLVCSGLEEGQRPRTSRRTRRSVSPRCVVLEPHPPSEKFSRFGGGPSRKTRNRQQPVVPPASSSRFPLDQGCNKLRKDPQRPPGEHHPVRRNVRSVFARRPDLPASV